MSGHSRLQLPPHYAAVLQLTGLAACRDNLQELFPLYTNTPTELRPSQQGLRLLERMQRNQETLAHAGIRFGRSRLAVRGNLPSTDGG